jgi:hypothetical protein
MSNPVGRPRIFKTPQELSDLIDEYIKEQDESKEPILKVGFCNWMQMSKENIAEYATKSLEYSRAIKRLEIKTEEYLSTDGLKERINPTMAIFLLKNNHGYKDKQETVNENYNFNQSLSEYKAQLDAEREAAIKEKNAAESQK